MSTVSFASVWIERFERDRKGYEEVSRLDPFENWANRDQHGSIAEMYFWMALDILYGRGDTPLAETYLTTAVNIVNRAEREERFDSNRLARAAFPMNRGVALRARAYATALLTEVLPAADVAQASYDIEEWWKSFTGRQWDSQAQAKHLASIRMALIAEDREQRKSKGSGLIVKEI